ncbi:MAG TPA: PilZ domain-containing protein [Terriglobia bacterium]|nr:PilZ domain-containing protein [Terriglobia bacterium]
MWEKREAVIDLKTRQSERVSLALPVEVIANDLFGDVFLCEGCTEVVSQTGARVRLKQNLASDQEITVRCLETGKEAPARVVARVSGKSRQNVYGIMLLNPEAPPWGINFPQRGDSVAAVGRIVLECLSCHTRELVYLDGFELEVLESSETLSRFCRRCTDSTMWRKTYEPFRAPTAEDETSARIGQDARRDARHEVRTVACIQSREHGDELVRVRNVSRSGLCFEGRRPYEKDSKIEVAIPFSSGGGNVFLPARVVRAQNLPPGAVTLYGVEYVRR